MNGLSMYKIIGLFIAFLLVTMIFIWGLQKYMQSAVETQTGQSLEEASDQQMKIQKQVEDEIKKARENK